MEYTTEELIGSEISVRVSCDANGSLVFQDADGHRLPIPMRNEIITAHRGALIAFLDRACQSSQALLHLDEAQPQPRFRVMPNAPQAAGLPDSIPPAPVEPLASQLPPPTVAERIIPLLRERAKARANQIDLEALEQFRAEHAQWTARYAHDLEMVSQANDRAIMAFKTMQARLLRRQLLIVKGADHDSVMDSFEEQLRHAAWSEFLTVDANVALDCRSGHFTIDLPAPSALASIVPRPCTVDRDALCLRFGTLTQAELKRRYDAIGIASMLNVAAVAFTAIPTLTSGTFTSTKGATDAEVITESLRHYATVTLTRQQWSEGWQTPRQPLFELQRLNGRLSI